MSIYPSIASSSNSALRLKEAVLASFHEASPEVSKRLEEFQPGHWDKVQFWLDASGLALYLLDRLTTLHMQHLMPETLQARLQQKLRNNRQRSEALFEEAAAISGAFRKNGLSFALLKGATLVPESVPDSALRSQWDLDFLVAEKDATAAQHVIRDFGYALDAVSGMTWEFRAGASGVPDIANIYKVRPYRALELHLLPRSAENARGGHKDVLERAQLRCIRGATLPTLSPADLFIHQGLHLFKHLCGEYTRVSWVLEFWRHLQARGRDKAFWRDVKSIAGDEPHADTAIGAAALLTTSTFGKFAPEELSCWTIDQLPSAVRLWIETYGNRVLLTDFPGSKLYLLLRSHLHGESGARQADVRRLVIPAHLPPGVTHGNDDESFSTRLRRLFVEAGFVLFRLRFHLVEGIRYGIESSRWQRRLTGITH